MTGTPAYPDHVSAADPRAPWNEPEPWEGRECKDCDHFCRVRTKYQPLCIQDAVDNGSLFVDEAKPTDAACEAFKEIGAL